jgi:hypothetical protein
VSWWWKTAGHHEYVLASAADFLLCWHWCGCPCFYKNKSTRPSAVNIGSIFTLNSSVGKVAKVAIEAAVDDVNSNPALLKGTKLKLAMQDTNSSGFLGIVEGTSILLKPSNHDCLFLDGSDHTIRYGHMVVLSQPHDP